MGYLEDGFYPAWVPHEMRLLIDMSELAEPTTLLIEEANRLMERLGAYIAVYKRTPRSSHSGLCSFFKAASLQSKQFKILFEVEQSLKDYVIVAYAKPLLRQDKTPSIR